MLSNAVPVGGCCKHFLFYSRIFYANDGTANNGKAPKTDRLFQYFKYLKGVHKFIQMYVTGVCLWI